MTSKGSSPDIFQKGMIFLHRGDLHGAQRLLANALKIERQCGDHKKISAILGNLGNIHSELGEKEKARALYQEILEIQKISPDTQIVGQTLVNLGNLCREMGDLPRANAYYLEAKNLFEKAQDHRSLGILYSNCALLEENFSHLEEAIRLFKKAIELHKKTGNEDGLASTWGQLGRTYRKANEDKKAETCFNHAFTHFGQIGHSSGEAEALISLANLYEDRDDPELALHCMVRLVEINRRYPLPNHQEYKNRMKRLQTMLFKKTSKRTSPINHQPI